jgi:hypothetical protein
MDASLPSHNSAAPTGARCKLRSPGDITGNTDPTLPSGAAIATRRYWKISLNFFLIRAESFSM